MSLYIIALNFRTVKEAEGNYHAMITAEDVVDSVVGKLSNMMTMILKAEQIDACDEDNVKSIGKGFIRNYHHFSYRGAGILACRYIKGSGDYSIHRMKQGAGECNLRTY